MKIISLAVLILTQTLVDCNPIEDHALTTEESSTVPILHLQFVTRNVRDVQDRRRTVEPPEHQHVKNEWSKRCCAKFNLIKEQPNHQKSAGRTVDLKQKREVTKIQATAEEGQVKEIVTTAEERQVTGMEATDADVRSKRQIVEIVVNMGSVEDSATTTDAVVLKERQGAAGDGDEEGVTESPEEQRQTKASTMDELDDNADAIDRADDVVVVTVFLQDVGGKLRKRADEGVETTEQTTEDAGLVGRSKRITTLNELKDYLERGNPPAREDVDLDEAKELLLQRQVEEVVCSHHHHQHHQQSADKSTNKDPKQDVEQTFNQPDAATSSGKMIKNTKRSSQHQCITKDTADDGIVTNQSDGVQQDLSRLKRSPAVRQEATTSKDDSEDGIWQSSVIQNQEKIWNFDNPHRVRESAAPVNAIVTQASIAANPKQDPSVPERSLQQGDADLLAPRRPHRNQLELSHLHALQETTRAHGLPLHKSRGLKDQI